MAANGNVQTRSRQGSWPAGKGLKMKSSMTRRFPGQKSIDQQADEIFCRSSSPKGKHSAAAMLLRSVVPGISAVVLRRLHQEKIRTAADLVGLDKSDLQELGLTMAERSRVLAWSRQLLPLHAKEIGDSGSENNGSDMLSNILAHDDDCQNPDEEEAAAKQRLEDIEADADFWCSLASSWTAKVPLADRCKQLLDSTAHIPIHPHGDVREDLLERLFDLSPARVLEVFESMRAHAAESGEGRIEESALSFGLSSYGLPKPDETALHRLLHAVVADKNEGLQLDEFEAILSRIVLSQLFTFLEESHQSISSLQVMDYSARGTKRVSLSSTQELRKYFFGHRPKAMAVMPPVRWVHLKGLDLPVLLALAAKYSLHPLAVEDTIQQRQSKIDSFGHHYFGTIERMSLTALGMQSPHKPVQVQSHHLSIFCAGAPSMDTVVTVVQEDKSFEQEWPGGVINTTLDVQSSQLGMEKIRKRLEQPLSRLRERRGNFFIHAVLDVCTDELCEVVEAFESRLQVIDSRVQQLGTMHPIEIYLDEVAMVRLQLAVVNRRAKGLQRVVKRMLDDAELSIDMGSYLQDVVDHIDEALDDCGRLREKCGGIQQSHEQVLDREQEKLRQKQAERERRQEQRRSRQADYLNSILFVLTWVTTVFAPIQFIAGVYGMNFVDESGRPTVPELLWKHGYAYFWILILGYLILASAITVCLFYFLRQPSEADADLTDDEEQPMALRRTTRRSRQTSQLSSREPLLIDASPSGQPVSPL
eukprot:TRINITY_DN14368_c0_g1_i2.p1 TRINITY_DN14368_c0_g1~~TRINITY_DN14368_c0_g1_i2.p1  ORF type:complete len:759 (+),score=132.24 TRINITY_DN14368_c0_g1_i2:90-2366(+)